MLKNKKEYEVMKVQDWQWKMIKRFLKSGDEREIKIYMIETECMPNINN